MSVRFTRTCVLALFAVVFGLIGTVKAANHNVVMSNFQFVPATLTINVGDSVTWTNEDFARHNTVSGSSGVANGVWNSNNQYGRLMQRGETFTFTFQSA